MLADCLALWKNIFKMAEDLMISKTGDKAEQYESLIPQIEALLYGETDQIANLANLCAALKEQFGWFWVGFYLVKDDELVLGPFQGPVACTRIKKGKGVCGASWQQEKVMLVPNVDEFPGHIACASASKSEIVVPVFDKNGDVSMVLDVDSDKLDDFSEVDKEGLEALVRILEKTFIA